VIQYSHALAKAKKCFDILVGVLKYIVRGGPFARFAKYHDGRSAEAESAR
jgi:hypothetical protein